MPIGSTCSPTLGLACEVGVLGPSTGGRHQAILAVAGTISAEVRGGVPFPPLTMGSPRNFVPVRPNLPFISWSRSSRISSAPIRVGCDRCYRDFPVSFLIDGRIGRVLR